MNAWPQIVYLTMTALGLVYIGTQHGKTERVNAWARLAASIFIWLLLYWGGFWAPLAEALKGRQ